MKKLFSTSYANANPVWLAFFRCSICFISLVHFMAIQPDFDTLFSQNAIVPPDLLHVLNIFRGQPFPSVYDAHHFLTSFLPVSFQQVLLTVRVLYPLSLVLLLLGLVPRISAICSLLLQLTLLSSVDAYNYGVDVFTTIALFYCVIFPVGKAYSLQQYFTKKRPLLTNHTKYLHLLQAHVCIAYFFSGFEKLLGANWRNGEAIWKMMHGYNTGDITSFDFLYNTPFFTVIGWGTIILEMFYPLFINMPKTRKAWLIAAVCFHVSIAFCMGLYFFSGVMIILNLTCYYVPFIKVQEKEVTTKQDSSNSILLTA